MRKMLTSKDEEALKELLYKGFLDTNPDNPIAININMATLVSDNNKVLITQDINTIYLDFNYFYSKTITVSLTGVSPKPITVHLPSYCDFYFDNMTGVQVTFEILSLVGRTIFIVHDMIQDKFASYLMADNQTTITGITDGRISFATLSEM